MQTRAERKRMRSFSHIPKWMPTLSRNKQRSIYCISIKPNAVVPARIWLDFYPQQSCTHKSLRCNSWPDPELNSPCLIPILNSLCLIPILNSLCLIPKWIPCASSWAEFPVPDLKLNSLPWPMAIHLSAAHLELNLAQEKDTSKQLYRVLWNTLRGLGHSRKNHSSLLKRNITDPNALCAAVTGFVNCAGSTNTRNCIYLLCPFPIYTEFDRLVINSLRENQLLKLSSRKRREVRRFIWKRNTYAKHRLTQLRADLLQSKKILQPWNLWWECSVWKPPQD